MRHSEFALTMYPGETFTTTVGGLVQGVGADVFWLLRRIEIQSESLLNYLYSPFRG